MDWRQYEKEIFSLFKSDYPDADIQFDAQVLGRYSKVNRQIDILIEDFVAGNRMRIVVDAKYFNSNIDVKDVESFIGMLADVGAHKGLLITQTGYSPAAINRAFNDSGDIELDILNFKDLLEHQGFLAIPFAGDNGVLLPAPFGWVVDVRTSPGWLALLYQRGLDLEEAQAKQEWMYVNFWNRKKDGSNLEDLISMQEKYMLEDDPTGKIEYLRSVNRDVQTRLRFAYLKDYPTPEVTGFVEFDEFIFFCVLFTPRESMKKNVRKLENILLKVIDIKIKHPDK